MPNVKGLRDRIVNYYLLIIFILSPAYCVSRRPADGNFIGLLADLLTFPNFVWPSILLVGVVSVISNLRPMPVSIWFTIIITIWSLFISYAKVELGVYHHAQPGIIWVLVFVLLATLPSALTSRTVYFGLAYLSLVNLVLAFSQLSVGLSLQGSEGVLLAALMAQENGYYFTRATGVFDTPLALGVFGVFASFALAGMPNLGNRYHLLWVTAAGLLPFLAVAKTAIIVILTLVVIRVFFVVLIKPRRISNGLIFLTILLSIFLIVIQGVYLGSSIGDFSTKYKPAALAAFLITVLEWPQILVWGITNSTLTDFAKNLEIFISTESVSFESWLLRLIVFYGLPFFAWFFWMAFASAKGADLPFNRWYILCAFGSLLLTSMVSNGGAQPPTSFLVFALAGIIFAHVREGKHASRST